MEVLINLKLETWNLKLDKILGAIDQKETTAMVLLDMSKAFDGISHKTLLYKLQTYLLLLLLLIALSLKRRHGELSIKYCIVLYCIVLYCIVKSPKEEYMGTRNVNIMIENIITSLSQYRFVIWCRNFINRLLIFM